MNVNEHDVCVSTGHVIEGGNAQSNGTVNPLLWMCPPNRGVAPGVAGGAMSPPDFGS